MEAQEEARSLVPTGSAERPSRVRLAAAAAGAAATGPAAALASLAALCALAWAPPPGSLDDVFVVLADAREWLEGTPAPRVESSTSPLDVATKAVLLAALPGLDPLRASGWLALALTAVLAVRIALLAGALARSPDRGPTSGRARGGLAAAGWVALVATGAVLAPGVAEAAGYRLEGPLFALTWTGAAWSAATGRLRALVPWTVLLALTRPEGLLLAPVLGWIAGGSDRRVAARAAALGAGIAAALTGLRFAVYGALIPNTFHAKSSDVRWNEVVDGASYLAAVAVTWAGAGVILLAVGLVAALRRAGPEAAPARRLLTLAAVYAAVVVLSGGDGYLGARLALPVGLTVWLAAAAARTVRAAPGVRVLVLALALQAVGAAPRPWPGLGGAFGGAVAGLAAGPTGLEAFEGDARAFAAMRVALGDEAFAHRHVQRYRWFQPGAPVLDLTGLTDAEVARRPAPGPVRFGRDAVDLALDRRAGALHLDPMRARPAALAAADPLRALSDPSVAPAFGGPPYLDPELARRVAADYRGASFALPEAGGFFNLFVRSDLAERFRAAGFSVGGD